MLSLKKLPMFLLVLCWLCFISSGTWRSITPTILFCGWGHEGTGWLMDLSRTPDVYYFHAFPYSLDSSFFIGGQETPLLLLQPSSGAESSRPQEVTCCPSLAGAFPHIPLGGPGPPSHHLQSHPSFLHKPKKLVLLQYKVLSGKLLKTVCF